MLKKLLLAALAVPAFLQSPAVAAAGGQEQEYQQVRRIALRDPKVRAAYEAADRRLAAKIVQLDPALQNYAPGRPPTAAPPAPAARDRTAPRPGPARAHVVAKGETLGVIASRYGVSVAALKAANRSADERRLRVGQTLTIPRAAPR